MDRPEPAMDRLLRATINSWNGLLAAARTEAAFREELVALLFAVPLAFLIAQDAWKRVILIGVVLLVILVELLNTGLEKLADLLTVATHPGIKRIKDMGSAAVLIALVIAGLAWLLAVFERFAPL
jgi:diacylglycerol kinase (ATP)